MNRIHRPLLLAAALCLSLPAIASEDERPAHFKGKPAATLEEAFDNLATYNKKLETLLESELTPQSMAEIHQLTYTLENAVRKIDSEVADLAETLEDVHLASEVNNTSVTREKGKAYLDVAKRLLRE